MSILREFQLRIRNAANNADAIVVTSVRGGTNPYLSSVPNGDGASFNPRTGDSILGAYTGQIADWPIGSQQRIITSQLEDANQRQQLGYRHAVLEGRSSGGAWVTMCNGVLALLRLIDGATWEYTIQDPMRAQAVTSLFAPDASSTNITDFLTAWPNRGCILGGPVIANGAGNKIMGIQDLGGWTMKVEATADPTLYFLRPVNVYGPPKWRINASIEDVADPINQSLPQFQKPLDNSARNSWTTIQDTLIHGFAWTGVTALIDGVPWKPIPMSYQNVANSDGSVTTNIFLVSTEKGNQGLKIISDGTRTLTNGALVRVRVLTILPTETCPIYIAGHPVDALTTFWTNVGFAYNSAAAAALRTLIGADQWIALRITDKKQLQQLVNTICRAFGIGIRGNDAGELVPFDAWLGRSNTVPADTITSACVVDGSVSLPFELDPAQALQSISFNQKRFTDQRLVPFGSTTPQGTINVVDGVVATDETYPTQNGDATGVPFGNMDITIDGMIQTSSASYPTVAQFVSSLARTLYDRFGHGAQAAELTLLRGAAVGGGRTTDDIVLGQELLLAIPQLPNHNYRLGDNAAVAARAMQVVQRTVVPTGYQIRLLDSGPNAQPLATVPTLTIAASSDTPRTVAEFTITNAAALNALGYGARVQWATTSTGLAPSANQYTDVNAWVAGSIPTGAVRLPPVAAGTTIYVQARSEKPGGATVAAGSFVVGAQYTIVSVGSTNFVAIGAASNTVGITFTATGAGSGTGTAHNFARPSNYGSAAHVTLAALADPTSVTATPSGTDGSLCVVAWTPGTGATAAGWMTDIWLRNNGQAFTAAIKLAGLNAGSTRYTIEGLTPGNAYISSVQHRDPTTGDVSNPVDVSFTAGATTRTLTAPVFPQGFAGSIDPITGSPRRDGVYGLAVVAAEHPGFVEFAVATETSVGGGAYSSFVTVGVSIPAVLGDWTIFSAIAPNDGLRRQIKARHVAPGATSSSYSSIVTVTPWTPKALPIYPNNIIISAVVNTPASDTAAQTQVSVTVTAVDPQGGIAEIALTALTSNSSIVSGNALGTYADSPLTWVLARPAVLKGSAVVEFTGDTLPALGNRVSKVNVDIPEQGQQGAPVLVMTVPQDGHPVTQIVGNNDTLSYSWAESTSSMPSDATAIAGTVVNGSVVTITSSVTLAMGDKYYFKAVPWPQTSAGGTHGQIVSGTIDRQNKSTGKTILINWPWFKASGLVSNYNYSDDVETTNSSGVTLFAPIDIPPGATITSFSAELYSAGALDVATLKLQKFNGSGAAPTQVGSTLAATAAAGWTTPSSSFTEVAGTAPYHLQLFMQAVTTGNQGSRLSRATVTYTAPDLTTSR